jgi:hypothetical protein
MQVNRHDEDRHARRIAVVVRDVLASASFDTLADLTEAVKARCASLRLKYSGDDISEAYRLIASNRALVGHAPRLVPPPAEPEPAAPPAEERQQAKARVAELVAATVKPMTERARGGRDDHAARVRKQAAAFRRSGALALEDLADRPRELAELAEDDPC